MAEYIMIFLSLVVFINKSSATYYNFSDTRVGIPPNEFVERSEQNEVLSRRKRFITFPDGSSFQLVFCTENQGYYQPANLLWFGNTAALAWELPTDPKLFHYFKYNSKEFAQRRGDVVSRHVYYLDERGKLLAKVPFRRKMLINPAMSKRSLDQLRTSEVTNEEYTKTAVNSITIKEMHKYHKQKHNISCQNKLKCNVEFHRESRKSLYAKLEKFFDALGWKGRQCVMKLLCEAGKDQPQQAPFLGEIMRAVFTLPGEQHSKDTLLEEHDAAHKASGDCDILYPCENEVTSEHFYK